MGKIVGVILAVILVIFLAEQAAIGTGILKSTCVYTLDDNEEGFEGLDTENTHLLATSQAEPYGMSSTGFDAEGIAEIKLKKGSYWLSLENAGFVLSPRGSIIKATGTSKHSMDISDALLYQYVILLNVQDIDGNKFGAEDITLGGVDILFNGTGESADGSLVAVLLGDIPANGLNIKVHADGYEDVVVKADMLSRVSRLSVTLQKEGESEAETGGTQG